MRKNKHTLLYIGGLFALLLMACNRQTVYNRYLHTPLNGWERNDTLRYFIPTIQEGGYYSEDIGIRIDGSFPFMKLDLIIEQTKLNTQEKRMDTLQCAVIDNHGHPIGNGISKYQYTFKLTTLKLNKGDSLRIAIRHNMKREMLPGISEVGVRLYKRQTKIEPDDVSYPSARR